MLSPSVPPGFVEWRAMKFDDVDGADVEEIHIQPYGVPHKRIGESSLPPMLKAADITQLPNTWQSSANDVLLVLSPGLMPNFQILESLFTLVGDPLAVAVAEMGELGMACNFRRRLLESMASDELLAPQNTSMSEAQRCIFTALPPELIPLASFEKVVVFLADPRYVILREMCVWDFIQKCTGRESVMAGSDISEFLRTYLETSSPHLAGEELQRLAEWAAREHEQPHKLKIVCAEDFVSDTAAAFQDLALFLGASPGNMRAATGRALAAREGGLFYPRSSISELEHFLELVTEFENNLVQLPGVVQSTWYSRVATWTRLPNHRMRALGLSMQGHAQDCFEAPAKFMYLHNAGLCMPCSYFHKNTCRQGDNCAFCHVDRHAQLARPSKKERWRRKKRITLQQLDVLEDAEGDD